MSLNGRNKAEIVAVILAITGNVFWGFSNMLIKVAMSVADSWIVLALRFDMALLLLTIPVLLGRQKLHFGGRKFKLLLILALLEPVYYFFESFAIKYTNVTYASVVQALTPVTAAIAAAIVLSEIPTRKQAFFALFPVVGILLMVLSGNRLGIVDGFGIFLLAGICITSAVLRSFNRSAAPYFSAYERTYAMMLASCLVFNFRALMLVNFDLGAFLSPLGNPVFLVPVVLLVIFCSIGSSIMVNFAASRLSVMELASYSSICTIVSMFSGIVFLHEPLTFQSFIGTVLVLIGLRGMNKAAAEAYTLSAADNNTGL